MRSSARSLPTRDAGRNSDAARVALTMSYEAFRSMSESVGGGWLARATRLLETVPDSPYHAWLAMFRTFQAIGDGRLDEGIALADEGMEIARSRDNVDALYLLMSLKGMALVFRGDLPGGLALVDEAAAAASSGQLGLRVAADIFCNTIAACRNIGDLERARQWADEGERFMRREGIGGYPGVCRIHRAEIKMLRGQWLEAEQEARQAGEELLRYRLLDVGRLCALPGRRGPAADGRPGRRERGVRSSVRVRTRCATGPGPARSWRVATSPTRADSIDRALIRAAGAGGSPIGPSARRLLPAQVEITLAAGDLEAAREPRSRNSRRSPPTLPGRSSRRVR